jgi:hypothetical protein
LLTVPVTVTELAVVKMPWAGEVIVTVNCVHTLGWPAQTQPGSTCSSIAAVADRRLWSSHSSPTRTKPSPQMGVQSLGSSSQVQPLSTVQVGLQPSPGGDSRRPGLGAAQDPVAADRGAELG